MRDYGKVHTTFWSSSTIRGLSEDGRALALYLLTSPHGTIAGVFRLPDGYACEDLQWTSERVAEGFRELFAKGFADRCETTKWVWISKHFEWNKPENPNQRKSAAKVALSIPDECAWKPCFMRVWADFLGIERTEKGNPCGTVAEPFANQEQEQEQEQEEKLASLRSAPPSAAPDGPPPAAASTAERLAQVTAEAIAAFNASPLTKAQGGNLPAVNASVGKAKRQAQVKRCLRVAREICKAATGSTLVTPEFWQGYFAAAAEDDFYSGRRQGGPGHEGYVPDFELLTREATMLRIFDRSEAAA